MKQSRTRASRRLPWTPICHLANLFRIWSLRQSHRDDLEIFACFLPQIMWQLDYHNQACRQRGPRLEEVRHVTLPLEAERLPLEVASFSLAVTTPRTSVPGTALLCCATNAIAQDAQQCQRDVGQNVHTL